jgi:hypothetical protein
MGLAQFCFNCSTSSTSYIHSAFIFYKTDIKKTRDAKISEKYEEKV